MKLMLGVNDIPYADAKGVTTGDVAEILERKYHPMEVFAAVHGQEIADDLGESVKGALEDLMAGAPPAVNPFGGGEAKITDRFQRFITEGEMESLGIPGVPTKAAIERKSGRFKKGRSTRPRPSLVATGAYVDDFKAWVE